MNEIKGKKISNWENYPTVEAMEKRFRGVNDLRDLRQQLPDLISRGLGRSYGDASLYKRVTSTLRSNRMLALDGEKGTMKCESGTRFAAENGKAMTVGSDAHLGYEFGRSYLKIRPFADADGFMANLRSSGMSARRSPLWVHIVSKSRKFMNASSRREKGPKNHV